MTRLGVEDEDMDEPNPDIHALFCYYNILYFDNALGACILSWSSKRMTLCAGVCHYLSGGSCEIRLSEPLLKFRSSADLKNTLLHEMIHAYLWIKNKNKDHSDHGPSFQKLMKEINSSLVIDHQCQSCGDLIKRAMNREPSSSDCVVKASHEGFCGNSSCHWHIHKMSCTGNYKKIAEPPGYKDTKKGSKGKPECQGRKSQVPTQSTRKSARKAYKEEASKDKSDFLKSNTIDTFYPSKVNRNTGSPCPCSDDDQAVPVQTAEPRKKRKSAHVESNESQKHENNYAVIINCKRWYANEEDEEYVEPLHNKRSERRAKQRLLKNLTGVSVEVEATDDASHTSGNTGNSISPWLFKSHSIPSEGKEECDTSINSGKGHTQVFGAEDVNDGIDHFQKGLHTCDEDDDDDDMHLDTCQTRQEFAVGSSTLNYGPVTCQGSADVSGDCRKTTLGRDGDSIVDVSDD
ncbi:uncharacterized protein LOC131226615 isoform X2 [Magnolia sinica]|uniref:uncharacterized protein LOC131226615 isoform X2 n=1 Tax=Magnolia sinica TaxID=86752 RepID=UPI002658BCB8|nr:uncharacterized protein LOC131226615 isoform X2 [Magnolia sinica]